MRLEEGEGVGGSPVGWPLGVLVAVMVEVEEGRSAAVMGGEGGR